MVFKGHCSFRKMWLRQWTVKIGITISLGLTLAFIQWLSPKCHIQCIFNLRRVLRTHILMFYCIWYEVIIGLKRRIWPYFMFIKVKNYLAPNFTTKDFRIQVRVLLPIMSMAVTWRGALEYVSYQKGIIQGHLVNRYASRRAPALCSRIVFRTVLSLDVSTQTIYLYHMSEKYSLRGYLGDFRCTCYALLVRSNKWNQYKFSILYRLSI